MGTDIHAVLAMKNTDGKWLASSMPAYDSRNYRVFAILANVRNGYGFAGTYTHKPLVPIQDRRPWPDGFSTKDGHIKLLKEYSSIELSVWMGDHSFGYVTIAELLAYDWDQPIYQGGVVGIEEFNRCKSSGDAVPNFWSGDVIGRGIVISEEYAIHEKTTHVRMQWSQPLRNTVMDFYSWLQYIRYNSYTNPEKLYLIFGFDS